MKRWRKKTAIFDADPPRVLRKKQRQLESMNSQEDVRHQNSMMTLYVITEKYTTISWIVSSMPSKIDLIRKISKYTPKGSYFNSEYNDVMALYDSDFDRIRFHVQLEMLSDYRKKIVQIFYLLKITKAYWRSTMIQGRLNHLMILRAYRNLLGKMDLRKVASIFVEKNDDRRHTFRKFEFCWLIQYI